MKKIDLMKGFTLIELLVVVAIIGILASVVLASLNTARAKGADAAIKAAMTNARGQAELFYDTAGQTYAGVCTTAGGIGNLILNAAQKLLATNTVGITTLAFTYSATGAAGSSVCHDTAAGYAAITSLKSPAVPSSGWCVDSTGTAKEATVLSASSILCGS